MKVGDKIRCIKERRTERILNDYIINYENKLYEILEISNENNFIAVSAENPENPRLAYRLYIYSKEDPNIFYMFEEYFDKKRFERKEKLEKLKCLK
jgi:hypothetical protein